MIVIDTNVMSEMMQAEPDTKVRTWFADQPASSLYTTAVTLAEIRYGIMRLPSGHCRTALGRAADQMFAGLLAERILPFDGDAAEAYALLAIDRSRNGMPIQPLDCQIAAISRSRNAAVATRNVTDFQACGVSVVDPWR